MKKFLSVILAVIMTAVPFCTESFAAENYDDLVAPCIEYASLITATLEEGSLGFVQCTSELRTAETGVTYVLTCCLQRSTGTTSWDNYKEKAETYTGIGKHVIQKNWLAPSGYNYRVMTKVQVKNSSDVIIAIETEFSPILYK